MKRLLVVAFATVGVLALIAVAWFVCNVLFFFGGGMCSAPDCRADAQELERNLFGWWQWGSLAILVVHFFLSVRWLVSGRSLLGNAPRN